MADPSMDKQEFYVATSRTREQTYLYATPEIQAERSEYAPAGPERDAIAHVAEAAERDRAQTAAHDVALRAELAKLPTTEIAARHRELGTPARGEARHQESYTRQVGAVEERRGQVEQAAANREAVEALGWRERRQKLPSATERERLFGERLAEERAKLTQMEPPSSEARREREIAGQLLDTPLGASARRREDRAARLHRQGARTEARRSGEGQDLGSRRPRHRELPV
jgi:hypothetical protein